MQWFTLFLDEKIDLYATEKFIQQINRFQRTSRLSQPGVYSGNLGGGVEYHPGAYSGIKGGEGVENNNWKERRIA